ncbi:hypothetical protein BpHYR1_019379, partial [Brachionus plicatilis]
MKNLFYLLIYLYHANARSFKVHFNSEKFDFNFAHAVSDITPVCFWRNMSSDKIDIIEIASNWPSLGQGYHSEVVRWHHSLLKSVVDEIATLKQEIVDLKKFNEMQANELIQLKSSPSTATSTP